MLTTKIIEVLRNMSWKIRAHAAQARRGDAGLVRGTSCHTMGIRFFETRYGDFVKSEDFIRSCKELTVARPE
jgi:hypothetical protein